MGTADAPRFLGIDVGTQSIRAALSDGTGMIQAVARTPLVGAQMGWESA